MGCVQSFSHLQLEELQQSVELRRNRIFLLMEEVRRLRIQQRIKVPCLQSCNINLDTVHKATCMQIWHVWCVCCWYICEP